MKIAQRLFFVLSLSVLFSCSYIAISYNNADPYLRYTINSYTSFNPEQKNKIKAEVAHYMQWHRTAMLPQYIDFLQKVQRVTEFGAPLKLEEVTHFRGSLKLLMGQTLQPAIQPTANLLGSLNAQQISELARSFEEKNHKQRAEDLVGSLDERLKNRAKKTIGYIEDAVGHLSDQQLANIRGMSYGLPYAAEIYMHFKETQQARLIGLLNAKASEDAIAEFLSVWLFAPEVSRSANDQKILTAFEQASDQMIVDIYNILDVQQKKTLRGNIAKYIEIFQELAQKH
jgi:hypothetical protein